MLLADGASVGGKYSVICKVGQGKAGGAVYRARGAAEGAPAVALKYPVGEAELAALRRLAGDGASCPGVPRLLAWGEHEGRLYVAMDLLGTTFMKALRGISRQALVVRWRALAALGRMLLRRLEAIHRRGLLHNDVQPENVLFSAQRGATTSDGPFLIDYGWARPFPNGGDMKEYWGSVDYSSIHSASGSERDPYDDLESLGWVLCHGLFGDLPWFQLTKGVRWIKGRPESMTVCEKVRDAKAAFLACSSFGPGWSHLARVPQDLMDFLRLCQWRGGSAESDGALPDYAAFAALLGSTDSRDGASSDAADQQLFQRCLDLTCEEFEAAALEEAELNFAGLRDLPEPARNLAPIGDRKVRILALHANGANSNIMKFQTIKMRKAFGSGFEWLIPDAPMPWEPDSSNPQDVHWGSMGEIGKRLANGKPFVQWYQASKSESYRDACRWLVAFVEHQGPIDAIVAFQDSSAFVHRVTDDHQKMGLHAPWRLTVVCNGGFDAAPFASAPPFWQPLVYLTSPGVPLYECRKAAISAAYRDALVLEHGDGGGGFPVSEPAAGELYERLMLEARARCGQRHLAGG